MGKTKADIRKEERLSLMFQLEYEIVGARSLIQVDISYSGYQDDMVLYCNEEYSKNYETFYDLILDNDLSSFIECDDHIEWVI